MVPFRTQANPDIPGVTDIQAQELWLNRGDVKIVDVRRPDEYEGPLGHIAGAELIVLDTLPEHVQQLPKDKPLVFVCRSGGRSARAAAFAKQEGYQQVYNLAGGMMHWNDLQLEVEGRNS